MCSVTPLNATSHVDGQCGQRRTRSDRREKEDKGSNYASLDGMPAASSLPSPALFSPSSHVSSVAIINVCLPVYREISGSPVKSTAERSPSHVIMNRLRHWKSTLQVGHIEMAIYGVTDDQCWCSLFLCM